LSTGDHRGDGLAAGDPPVSWYLRSLTLDATMTTATVLTLAQAVEMAQATLPAAAR
jgi:hypothetical protein